MTVALEWRHNFSNYIPTNFSVYFSSKQFSFNKHCNSTSNSNMALFYWTEKELLSTFRPSLNFSNTEKAAMTKSFFSALPRTKLKSNIDEKSIYPMFVGIRVPRVLLTELPKETLYLTFIPIPPRFRASAGEVQYHSLST